MRRTLRVLFLVLLPFSGEALAAEDIMSILAEREDLRIYLLALESTKLSQELKGEGPYTLFAANDFAFSKLHPENVESLLFEPAALTTILQYHLVAGRLFASDIRFMSSTPSLHGQPLTFSNDGQRVDSANLVVKDILAANGVIHIVDALVVPQDARQFILHGYEWR